jgi:hypothetical protein
VYLTDRSALSSSSSRLPFTVGTCTSAFGLRATSRIAVRAPRCWRGLYRQACKLGVALMTQNKAQQLAGPCPAYLLLLNCGANWDQFAPLMHSKVNPFAAPFAPTLRTHMSWCRHRRC